MTRTCQCGLVWLFDPVQKKDRKANTHYCDCGEILLTSFGNVAYLKSPVIRGPKPAQPEERPDASH